MASRYRRWTTAICSKLSGLAAAGACRLAETRFGVVLTETDEIAAINFVERVREAGPKSMPKGFDELQFRFGWASAKPGDSADTLVRRAETRLAAELAEA